MVNYKGILGKAGESFNPETRVHPNHLGKKFEDYAEERERALFEHFGIERYDINSWRNLALSLAESHVPAYQRSQGRPSVNGFEDIMWFEFFLVIKEVAQCTNKEAYERIAARHDVSNSAEEIKERLKKLKRKSPLECQRAERMMAISPYEGYREGHFRQVWAQTILHSEKEAAIVEHHQHYSRFPYGPHIERDNQDRVIQLTGDDIPPFPEKKI
ncbi:hypothetical protein GCM10008927_28740 [Amylibacter ulvae]|uniref:Uncharacterized protein n=1 Tax=Paramylibacter ulvae TaxID=1651968 RepID=A0ABQ3DCV5_9RHOB|nr:hypothetical protein [Amylibacter ulvae]GHA61499.1 hypothetical protein GCM10008927_28740 [Amylibacter ulvae]